MQSKDVKKKKVERKKIMCFSPIFHSQCCLTWTRYDSGNANLCASNLLFDYWPKNRVKSKLFFILHVRPHCLSGIFSPQAFKYFHYFQLHIKTWHIFDTASDFWTSLHWHTGCEAAVTNISLLKHRLANFPLFCSLLWFDWFTEHKLTWMFSNFAPALLWQVA